MFPLSQNNLYTQMQISTSRKKDQYSIKYPMQNNLKIHQITDDLDINYKRNELPRSRAVEVSISSIIFQTK